MRISLKIKTNHPDQSNPKYYAQGRWFFSKPLGKSLFFIAKMSGLTMIQLASSDFWKVPLVSSLHSPIVPWYCYLFPLQLPFTIIIPSSYCLLSSSAHSSFCPLIPYPLRQCCTVRVTLLSFVFKILSRTVFL